jgi:hypothetical protein
VNLLWSRTLNARWAADRIRFAIGEGTIAWWAWEPPPPRVGIIDAFTGVELHREVCSPLNLFPTATGYLTLDLGWRGGDRVSSQLVAFICVGRQVEVSRLPAPAGSSLTGADPRSDRYVLSRNSGLGPHRAARQHAWAELRAWGEQKPLATWAPRRRVGVDWDAGCLWGVVDSINRPSELLLDAVDGSWSDRFELARPGSELRGVGSGVLRFGYRGIHLFRPGGPILTVLRPTSRPLEHVRVTDMGRTVRVLLGGRPRRFTIDLDRHVVLHAPPDALRLAGASRRKQVTQDLAWHPTRDRIALVRRWPRCAVYACDGEFLWPLPKYTRPRAWLTVPDALVAVREDDEDTAMLELWSVSS